jgi:hypothetical protein
MDALILTGIMGLATPAFIGAACWLDPKGAEWLAARLRGRAVELRMMKLAKSRAKARAGEVYQECRVGWEKADQIGQCRYPMEESCDCPKCMTQMDPLPKEAQANG